MIRTGKNLEEGSRSLFYATVQAFKWGDRREQRKSLVVGYDRRIFTATLTCSVLFLSCEGRDLTVHRSPI